MEESRVRFFIMAFFEECTALSQGSFVVAVLNRFALDFDSKRVSNVLLYNLSVPPLLSLLMPLPMKEILLTDRRDTFAPDRVTLILTSGFTLDRP